MSSSKKVLPKNITPKTKLSLVKSVDKKKIKEWFQKGLTNLKSENEQNRFLKKITVSRYPLMIFNLVIYVIILVYLFSTHNYVNTVQIGKRIC